MGASYCGLIAHPPRVSFTPDFLPLLEVERVAAFFRMWRTFFEMFPRLLEAFHDEFMGISLSQPEPPEDLIDMEERSPPVLTSTRFKRQVLIGARRKRPLESKNRKAIPMFAAMPPKPGKQFGIISLSRNKAMGFF